MRIAVACENGQVFQHFGHTKRFKLYDTDARAVRETSMLAVEGEGHGALAGLLKENGVDAVICGGIGEGARQALQTAGIRLYAGVSGGADDAVRALLDGTLAFSDQANCGHHAADGHPCHGDGR